MWIIIVLIVAAALIWWYLKTHNNSTVITKNLTYMYKEFKSKYGDRFANDRQIFLACGVLDTLAYLQEGRITYDAIEAAVNTACKGTRNESHFVAFVLQIQLLIYMMHSSMSPYDMMEAVLSSRNHVHEIVKKHKNRQAPTLIQMGVANFMDSDSFQPYRQAIGIE